MEKSRLIDFMQNSDGLDKSDADSILQVINDFPYFQTGQILLAKALENRDHFQARQRIKIASVYSGDRARLRDLLTGKLIVKKEPVKSGETIIPESDKTVKTAPEEVKVIQLQPVIPEKMASTEVVLEEISTKGKEAINEINPEEKKIEPKEPVGEVHENFNLELLKLESKNPAPIEIPIGMEGNSIPVPEIKETILPIEREPEMTAGSYPSKELAANPKVNTENEPSFTCNEKQSFTDWLKSTKSGKFHVIPSNPIEDISKNNKVEEPKIVKVNKITPTPKKPAEVKNLNNNLINKFIDLNPRITPLRAEFFKPSHAARQSVKEDDSLVTETLAAIYIKQGNIARGIKAYENLILKFPQKSSYFAGLIEELKKNLNKK